MRLFEVSPDTLEGSFTHDLLLSKTWLVTEIAKIQKKFDTIYVLGSWYGNTSLMLFAKHFKFDKIINVEIDRQSLRQGQSIAKKMGIEDQVEPMLKDANELDYRQLGSNGLVINTSCLDMKNEGWFDNIPKGTLVALQARDNAGKEYKSINKFSKDYSLGQVLFKGSVELKDPETEYQRFMLIGKK